MESLMLKLVSVAKVGFIIVALELLFLKELDRFFFVSSLICWLVALYLKFFVV